MLTQFELLSAAGGLDVHDDGAMSVSPLDGLAEYPMEQSEFEYIGTSLPSDAYYDVSEPPPDLQASLALSPSPAPPTTPFTLYDTAGYDTTTIIYDQDDLTPFAGDVVSLRHDLKSPQSLEPYDEDITSAQKEIKFNEDMSSYDGFPANIYDSSGGIEANSDTIGFGSLCDDVEPDQSGGNRHMWIPKGWDEGTGKGKIGPLQRRALDSIFSVTEKPSRGLVLHIASELGLHHLTVKNFFSNGRRRLRRAAARLSDPERTRRENERRKEKRRLAALASAALAGGDGKTGAVATSVKVISPQTPPADSPPARDAPVVSPERKALMEKLADKVQRSVAQRCLASEPDLPRPGSSATLLGNTSHFFSQATHDILVHPAGDILPQASHDILAPTNDILSPPSDILAQSTHDLLTHSPNDFLAEPTQVVRDSGSNPSSLLQPHIDPWNLF